MTWENDVGLARAHGRLQLGATVMTGGRKSGVRRRIGMSWQRCVDGGLTPDRACVAFNQDADLECKLLDTAAPVIDRLAGRLSGARVSIVIADAYAQVLRRWVCDTGLDQRFDAARLVPGFVFLERLVGTNSIGTTLVDRRPCFIAGREHFSVVSDIPESLACAGAPIRHPLSGRVEGVLNLVGLCADADPAMVKVVQQAAAAIEQRMVEQTSRRERELLAAFYRGDRLPPEGAGSGGPTWGEDPAALPGSTGAGRLDRADQALLRQRAAELIASPQQVAIEVPLSGGRTAALLRREITDVSGQVGVVVEAAVIDIDHPASAVRASSRTPSPRVLDQPGSLRSGIRCSVGQGAAGEAEVGASAGRVSTGPPHVAPPGSGDHLVDQPTALPWPLLVGEAGVGQMALQARRRLELLYDTTVRVGTTLDVVRTAEELAEAVVPRFADFAAVDLAEPVFLGDEPTTDPDIPLRRAALGQRQGGLGLYQVGETVTFAAATPQSRSLRTGTAAFEPELRQAKGWIDHDVQRTHMILESGIHSLITVPLLARGVVLGVVSFYRAEEAPAFEDDDLALAEELVGRAAVCIDNARRYVRERTMALALQRSLLPRGLPRQDAVEAAHRYLPAQAGVSGDWFDVIRLSGGRVALVVGDVVGHGVHAAATMGRLRTAVQNSSALDLPPEDLLAHLDDLVAQLDEDGDQILGATCLYAVYDPVSRRCSFTRAGHPPPAVVAPDGTVRFPEVPAGPPLGLGGLPFETVDIEVPEDSHIVLFTDGLIESRHRPIDAGLDLLRETLTAAKPHLCSPEEICETVVAGMLSDGPRDDVALLVARTRALDGKRTAHWDVPADPTEVSRARAAVLDKLEEWGLSDQSFVTELIVSELVTNAIRYGGGPIGLRLIRDDVLICEVWDGSSTSPRLRRARTTDEGGRGLFLVAQLASRWGTRYTADGKVIWTEQQLA
ncbi:SpoIIE family protein phosphatase [Streptomyces sp. NPDC008092]|uniref:SpoIIE family protein phosphatase n=1 Tax=Streptomyces sp. NPDC008092 TaxID=3364808 RepID=UPI0036EC6C16